MANANKPMGLIPVQYLNGSAWNGQARLYSIASNYGTALAVGDPVQSSGTSDTNGVPGVVLYAGTGAIRGVIVGIGRYEGLLANPGNLNSIIFPAGGDGVATPWYAMVVDDPQVLFELQEHWAAGATTLSQTSIGFNTTMQSGTNNGYYSGWQLSNATDAVPAVTATLPIRLMGLVRRIDNAFGAYAKHLVKINVHELGTGTGAAGV